MATIAFTISNSAPATLPTFDPRSGAGIAFHVNTNSNHVWVGLATTGTEKWGRFSTSSTLTASDEAEVGTFTVAYPLVTTSSAAPTEPPEFIPEDGKLHIHIAYKPSSQYTMYIGSGVSQWSIYNIAEVI